MDRLPALASLSTPKISGTTTWPKGAHPLRERECAACGVVGFAERIGDHLEARLDRAPEDGLVLLRHAGGMSSRPDAYLSYLMSCELFDALRREGLASGLGTIGFTRTRAKRSKAYVVILPEVRLEPMATPHGRDPEKRNCDVCGFVNAAHAKYPLYPRPTTASHWFLAPPWAAMCVYASREVWAYLLGPGRALYGARGASVTPGLPAGFWPDERDSAFTVPAD